MIRKRGKRGGNGKGGGGKERGVGGGGKPGGERPFGRPRCRWIKLTLKI